MERRKIDNMNLILQSLSQDNLAANAIAALSATRKFSNISPKAWRCEDVIYSDALKAVIDAACHTAKLDYAFAPPTRKLSLLTTQPHRRRRIETSPLQNVRQVR